MDERATGNCRAEVGNVMPQVTIKTGFSASNGREEVLAEYLCDWPDCPNIAVHVLGCVKEIGAVAAVCDEHAAAIDSRSRSLKP
jgi:hypothetical protein